MPEPLATQTTYDRRTIRYHWLAAALIALLWGGAHTIDWFPKGPLRVDARSLHILGGVCLLIVMGMRLRWRLGGATHLPPLPGPVGTIARIGHFTLYALTFATIALGLANAWIRGDSLFNLARIPAFGSYLPPARHALSEEVVGYHELGANLLLLLAIGHAAMAIVHQAFGAEPVLVRMLPRRRHAD